MTSLRFEQDELVQKDRVDGFYLLNCAEWFLWFKNTLDVSLKSVAAEILIAR